MTGAWRGGLSVRHAVTTGFDLTSSLGLGVNGSATTTYAKGPWTQLTASSSADSSWLMVFGETGNSGGADFAVDIGVGAAGSEVAFISNLCFSQLSSWAARYMFPVSVPAGTRISARISSNLTNDNMQVQITAFDDSYSSVGCGSSVDTYGFSNATNLGTAIDPGAVANTKGAYSQVTASLTNDISGFVLCFDNQANLGSSLASTLVDIAIGGAGSETAIISNYELMTFLSASANFMPGAVSPYIPMPIAAGTRIACRAQCSTATSPDRIIGVSFYGVRL